MRAGAVGRRARSVLALAAGVAAPGRGAGDQQLSPGGRGPDPKSSDPEEGNSGTAKSASLCLSDLHPQIPYYKSRATLEGRDRKLQ